MKRLAVLVLLLCSLPAVAAACEPEGQPVVLTIQEFGTAYFRDFTLDPGRNAAEFRNGVCLHAPDESWIVNAESIDITGLQPGMPIAVYARDATLHIENWVMTARELTSDGRIFAIDGGTFASEQVTGTVERVVFDLETGEIDGSNVHADGPGYRLTGARALFHEELLSLSDAVVTTCKCPGEPAYVLVGAGASVSLAEDGQVTLLDGEFRMGWLRLQLAEEFTVTDETLSGLSPPLMIEWDPAAEDEDLHGHGLALLVPQFHLHEDLTLEFGLIGVDRAHPLTGFFLLEASSESADLLLGWVRDGGPRADVSVQQELGEHMVLSIGANNRHYADQAWLHEGYLTVATAFPRVTFAEDFRLTYGGSFTAAVTSQTRAGEAVISPRFRSALFADLLFPEHEAGNFRLRVNHELSAYSQGRSQYGLRVRPSWSRSFGPMTISLSHDLRLTDSGSPFTDAVDYLTRINRTNVAANIANLPVEEDVTFGLDFSLTYNWLRFDSGDFQGVEDLSARFGLTINADSWVTRPHVRFQLAGLLDPRLSTNRLAFVEAGLAASSGDIELGLLARQHLGGRQTGLELLELSAAYPIAFEYVKLVPFVALDVAPAIVTGSGPLVSGHGLVIEWDSCCGLFEFGYRIHGAEFTTVLSAEFIH